MPMSNSIPDRVGPNGTGKSTILCAICLGLGGQPPLLGRADDARTFIMHEKDNAVIEVELAPHPHHPLGTDTDTGEETTHILRREIDRHKGSERGRGQGASTFYINRRKVTIKDVRKLVSETYNIQIDNLCTFLPQDRVGSFSGFNSQDLLIETEKALSASKHMYETHKKLIELEAEVKSGGNTVETIADTLKRLEAENERLEREKQLMEERKEYETRVERLEQKRVWLKFDEARQRAVEVRAERDRCREVLKQARLSLRPLEEKVSKMKQEKERKEARSKALSGDMKRLKNEHDKYLRKSETFYDEIDKDVGDLNSIDALQRRAEKQVEQQEIKVKDLELALEEFPPGDEVETNLKEAQADIREMKKKLDAKRRELGQVTEQSKDLQDRINAAVSKLDRMNDEKARRKERIFRQFPKLGETYKWLEQNRKMFRRPVWGPIACEVTTKSANAAAYLEQHVANSILKAYVVECKEDYNLLFRELREKRKLPVNIQIVPFGELKPLNRMYSSRKMDVLKREHGVLGYLDEAFSAPDPILQALRTTASVHSVLVGSEKTQESLDRHKLSDYLAQREDGRPGLMSSCIFSCHHDRSYKYTSQISRYSGKSTLRVDDINPARIMAPGTPPEQKEQLKQSLSVLENQLRDLEPRLATAQSEYNEILTEGQQASQRLKEVKEIKQEHAKAKTSLSIAKKKWEEYRQQASTDNVAEKEALLKRVRQHIKHCSSATEKAGEMHEEYMKAMCTLTGVKMTVDKFAARADKFAEVLREKQAETVHCEKEDENLSIQFNAAKRLAKEFKEKADRLAPMKDSRGNDLPLKAQLEQLPETLQEVEAAMDEAIAKINSITDNPEVLRQYEERKREIEKTQREMEGLNQEQDAKKAQLENQKAPWEAALINTLEKVNTLFSEYMRELGCAGEVHLARGGSSNSKRNSTQSENEDGNFKDWGIEIRVKFREKSNLQVLSARVQSGGERSVSTIMYLMALQELMVSPFRCVDEINQGLDERNERLVFKRIVQNSTRRPGNQMMHSGQYFLITPKLLPNLTDMEEEDVTVLFIFNGPFNFEHYSDYNIESFLNGRKRNEDRYEEEEEVAENGSKPRRTSAGSGVEEVDSHAMEEEQDEEDVEEVVLPKKRGSKRRSVKEEQREENQTVLTRKKGSSRKSRQIS